MEQQRKRFPLGFSNFKQLVERNSLLVDKSLLIKDVINDDSQVLILTRPRRFGKTVNLSMLYYFLRCDHKKNAHLFKEFKIAKDLKFCKQHQGKYPVILISFKEVKKTTFKASYAHIKLLIKELYSEHRYLFKSLAKEDKDTFTAILNKKANQEDVENAIKKLSGYMKDQFGKPAIILIDEYDTPIQEAYLKGYYEDMIDLMRSIFGATLKDNDACHKAIVTGITRIAQESLFSGINNVKVYSLLQEKYGQYFGFKEEEVLKLIKNSKKTAPIEDIRKWYNGYQVGSFTLYNPWSIMSCLENNGELEPYWVNTGGDGLINKLLKKAPLEVKQRLEELLQGNTLGLPISENLVFPNLEKKEEALWSLLLHAGYLKVTSKEFDGYQLMAKAAIPNKEVGFVYNQIITGWFDEIMSFSSYKRFTQSLIDGDMPYFKQYLSKYLAETISYFDFKKNAAEQTFHVFVLGMIAGLQDQYIIHSNQESGLGRCDAILIPKDKKNKKLNGILLEFKASETPKLLLKKAKEALKQIKDQQYIDRFKQEGISTILAIGLAFYKKQVELVSETISVNRRKVK